MNLKKKKKKNTRPEAKSTLKDMISPGDLFGGAGGEGGGGGGRGRIW